MTGSEDDYSNPFDLAEPIDLTEAWLDGTCLKANIHFPVDWILLKDICRTLMLATILIRKRGLKNRMPQSPKKFMRDMNKLVIAMIEVITLFRQQSSIRLQALQAKGSSRSFQ